MIKHLLQMWLSRYRTDWHRWYAWHPVRIAGGINDRVGWVSGSWVWMNTVERRWDDGSSAWGDTGHWDYRYV